MIKIYGVSTGQYDDWGIEAYFTEQKDAEVLAAEIKKKARGRYPDKCASWDEFEVFENRAEYDDNDAYGS